MNQESPWKRIQSFSWKHEKTGEIVFVGLNRTEAQRVLSSKYPAGTGLGLPFVHINPQTHKVDMPKTAKMNGWTS